MIRIEIVTIESQGVFEVEGMSDSWEEIDALVRRVYADRYANISEIEIRLIPGENRVSLKGILDDDIEPKQLIRRFKLNA